MRVLADDLGFTEGPVVTSDGACIFIGSDRLWRLGADGSHELFADPPGGPNGLAVASDGAVLVANNGLVCRPGKVPGSIQRVASDGAVTELVGDLDAPNDICVRDGAVYFTDPRDCWLDDDLRPGRVYRLDGDGLELLVEGPDYPNGIGFDAEGRLIVAESRTGRLLVVAGGEVDGWTRCPSGAPDGFCFTADGRCFVCAFDMGTVYAFDTDGTVVDSLSTGPDTWPTNCTIGPDGSLIVTEAKGGRLLAFDLGLRPL